MTVSRFTICGLAALLALSCGQADNSDFSESSTMTEMQLADDDTSLHDNETFAIPKITVSGRQLLVDGKPYTIRGVCYNPVRKGQSHPSGSIVLNPTKKDLVQIEQDFKMMKEAGLNTIRTYVVIRNSKVLALLNKYGLRVIVPVLNDASKSPSKVKEIVNALKKERSTLMWQVGNEWNYNKLYSDMSFDEAKDQVKETGELIKSLDTSHPLSTDYGELPSKELVAELKVYDIWGLNIYSGKTFGDRFDRWKKISSKPMYFGEFGADAINVDRLDLRSQAVATTELLQEIKDNLSANKKDNAILGGSIFAWVDGWWKDPNGRSDEQDVGGIAPGGGPYPDGVFNEEFWGLMTIDRKARPAYMELKKAWTK